MPFLLGQPHWFFREALQDVIVTEATTSINNKYRVKRFIVGLVELN